MTDRYYTPSDLAATLVLACSSRSAGSVADFAVGDGALLHAAKVRWPSARLIGCDIDACALSKVRERLPEAELHQVDFLQSRSPGCRDVGLHEKYNVVLLNPPFSMRGNQYFDVNIDGKAFRCGRAFAFISWSLSHLAKNGELVAIVPSYSLENELDQNIRTYLTTNLGMEVFAGPKLQTFVGCQVRVSVVRLSLSRRRTRVERIPESKKFDSAIGTKVPVRVMRGGLSVVDAKPQSGGLRFFHSTDLRSNVAPLRYIDVSATKRVVRGPALLIPRVGRPNQSSIRIVDFGDRFALSDCVIALQSLDGSGHKKIVDAIIQDWMHFESIYSGTGARFVTIKRLCFWLGEVGFAPVVVSEMDTVEGVTLDAGGTTLPDGDDWTRLGDKEHLRLNQSHGLIEP